MSETTTWPGLTNPDHSSWYIQRFKAMAEAGRDLLGEARLVDAMTERGSRVLDAGCGPGRHGAYLAAAGHTVVGADVDPALIEEARREHPECTWVVADLATLDLPGVGIEQPFDAIFSAGNVLDFVTPQARPAVLARLAAHLAPEGFIVIGCRTSSGFTPEAVEEMLPGTGMVVAQRFATWTVRPWQAGGDFAVTVLRRG